MKIEQEIKPAQPIQVQNYILFYKSDNDPIFKKNKKKLSKRGFLKQFNFKMVKYTEKNVLALLAKTLIEIKRNPKGTPFEGIGILFDTNIMTHDITFLPYRPIENYDILCLESKVKRYIEGSLPSQDDPKSIYWNKINLIDSGNFVINTTAIQTVINYALKSKDKLEFFENLNNLDIYSLTQYQFSERESDYVHNAETTTINNKLSLSDKKEHMNKINKEYYDKLSTLTLNSIVSTTLPNVKNLSPSSLPKLTLICPLTDVDLTYHALLTFLYLDYPGYLMEFIIIDSLDSQKKIKLPNDERIRFISLAPKDSAQFDQTTFSSKVTLGQQLNIAAKHASNDIIVHFLDTHNYNPNTFRQTIVKFMSCGNNCMISNKTGIYTGKNTNSLELDTPDLGNMIYFTSFWKINAFEESITTSYLGIIYKFINNRINLVTFIPFVLWSFMFKECDQLNSLKVSKELPFNLSNLIDSKLKESFNLL